MKNKSVEERAAELYPVINRILKYDVDGNAVWFDANETERAAYIKGRQEARQDQVVVGTQGREGLLSLLSDLIKGEHPDRSCSLEAQGYNQSECELLGEKDYWAQRAKTVLTNLSDWPVSEGEGMKWIKASERLPDFGQRVIIRTEEKDMLNFGVRSEDIDCEEWQTDDSADWYTYDTEWLYEPLPSPPQNQK